MESIIAATAGVAKLFIQETELGKIKPGYHAECILVDGDPLKDIVVLQEHYKLNVIMINGRIHKASSEDFITAPTGPDNLSSNMKPMMNSVAYENNRGRARMGHLDLDTLKMTPMVMRSGAPLENVYQAVKLENNVVPAGDYMSLDSVKLLPPISGRGILYVGKKYSAHAKEFNKSGYDSSDKVEQSSHPVIFTKRATSIIPSGNSICPHSQFTETLDYEGEIGAIVGKSGFGIGENQAIDHV